MKLLLENWRQYLDEVEAFDDIATTPEQTQQSIDSFFGPDFDKGKQKGEETWKVRGKEHQIITYDKKGDELHFVLKDGNPVAYVAVAPFRDGYAIGNVRKNTKDFFASDLYTWLVNKYGVLYSDKAQTTAGAKTWTRLPGAEQVDTSQEDGKDKKGKPRWRWRLSK